MDQLFDLTDGLIGPPALMNMVTKSVAPPPIPLAWDAPPPATLKVGVTGSATIKGGKLPIHLVVGTATDIIQDVDISFDVDRTQTINADGTNQPPGLYTWTATDSDGVVITATTDITA